MNTVTPKDIADDAVVLDVREQDEYDAGHAPRAIHILKGDDEILRKMCRDA